MDRSARLRSRPWTPRLLERAAGLWFRTPLRMGFRPRCPSTGTATAVPCPTGPHNQYGGPPRSARIPITVTRIADGGSVLERLSWNGPHRRRCTRPVTPLDCPRPGRPPLAPRCSRRREWFRVVRRPEPARAITLRYRCPTRHARVGADPGRRGRGWPAGPWIRGRGPVRCRRHRATSRRWCPPRTPYRRPPR